MSLLGRNGGMAIENLILSSEANYSASSLLCDSLVQRIIGQELHFVNSDRRNERRTCVAM